MLRVRTACALAGALAIASPSLAAAAPRLGDWELSSSHGAVGSFELASVAHKSHGKVARAPAVQDLVVQAPITCSNAFSTPLPIDTEVLPAAAALGKGGAFSLGQIKKGRSGTNVSARFAHGRFTIAYRHVTRTLNAYEGSDEVCDTGTIRLIAKPGRRPALKQGLWQGPSASSEPVELSVVAGGRALESPDAPGPGGVKEFAFQVASSNASDACAYQISYPLFIGSDGSFSNAATRLGDEAVLSGAFTGKSVSGSFSDLEESCAQESWSASWGFK
jgi:hypothetical protein